jgi:protein-S-isoprenylcysteine O-methyltransferase Ste14
MCTAYILVAIQLEERDLVKFHGEEYRMYRRGVSMLVPFPARKLRGGESAEKAV